MIDRILLLPALLIVSFASCTIAAGASSTTTSFIATTTQQRQQHHTHQSSLLLLLYATNKKQTKTVARDLIYSLVVEEQCYSALDGLQAFADKCSTNIVYEDCFEPQPVVGRTAVYNHMMKNKVEARKDKGSLRLDRISDGNRACGFAWTYTTSNEEGLRGTTFCELNEQNEIHYVREIPEPIYKPGDLTVRLLEAVTEGAKPKPPRQFEPKTPTTCSDMVKYLFIEVQGSSIDESMRCFDDKIIYRDFNYENLHVGKDEVREFVEKFQFPGIEFRPQRFDDGVDSCCFTWEVVLDGVEDQTIKGISYYELDEESRKVKYVRDVPESAIKPPILGSLARQLRPGLGVFQGVKLGSRPGGM